MQEKRDILFLCQFYYPEYISSATLPHDTAKALSRAGFKVDVICGYPKEYSDSKKVPIKENYKGINIKRLKYIQMKRSSVIGRLINYFSFTFSVLLNFREMKKYKSLIVYSNPPILPFIAALANKIYRTKIVFISYDIYPEIGIETNSIRDNGLIAKVMRRINKTFYKRVNTVVALSSEMKRYLLENRALIQSNQVFVIPNWMKDNLIENVKDSYNNKLFTQINPKEKLIVSYFGNMGIAQDMDTLINAATQLKKDTEVIFLFAGHGNKVSYLKKIAEKESLTNVFFYDYLHGEDFQDALNISDVFIVSLEDKLAGLAVPSKTYSYMMAGKPIIAIMNEETDIYQELINKEAGYGIRVGDTSKLVAAINSLKDDDHKKRLMGRNARKLFEDKYTMKRSTKKYVDLMNNVMEEK